jgi:hypothetical protein
MTRQQHDPKLVEAVARAIDVVRGLPTYEKMAVAALDPINASGMHWVAPWEAPVPAGVATNWRLHDLAAEWADWRDAYLAEQKCPDDAATTR